MNQKNFEYLRDQVKYTGFGESLESALKENMQKQTPQFQLTHSARFGNDELSATLHFKRSEQTDMYFFNRYQVSWTPEQAKDKMEQTFYINKEGSITLKEAYNLMNGRAVNKDLAGKEGQLYNAWLQMDFKEADRHGNYPLKQYHQNYGFDLEKELAKHPVKELTNEQDKARLMESLQKGNRQAVTFVKEGGEQRGFLEANPRFKTLNVYDSSMQRVYSQAQKNASEQSVTKQAKKNDQKQEMDGMDPGLKGKQSNNKKKGQSISGS